MALVGFQCSSASRKFLNRVRCPTRPVDVKVSVLFSEPKIPQCARSASGVNRLTKRFSALQRAENSSIQTAPFAARPSPPFQCSSASRKFLNKSREVPDAPRRRQSFSALQRAENSSIARVPRTERRRVPFQCSSASRKFLNHATDS